MGWWLRRLYASAAAPVIWQPGAKAAAARLLQQQRQGPSAGGSFLPWVSHCNHTTSSSTLHHLSLHELHA
jgi:hypothetical protein